MTDLEEILYERRPQGPCRGTSELVFLWNLLGSAIKSPFQKLPR